MGQYFDNDKLPSKMVKTDAFILGKKFTFFTDNGVFSKDGLDFGSRLLLETIPLEEVGGKVLDMGCGYGVFGITLNKVLSCSVDMVDVNLRALHLSEINAKENKCSNLRIFESFTYSNVDSKYTTIITNPPIRAGKKVVYDIVMNAKNYLEEASKYNVGIAVENLPVFPDCPQYNFFTSNYEDHIELVDSLDSDLIGVCWDFGHANLMKYDKAKVLDAMGERVKIVHMHNNTEMCDLHIAPCIGTVKWEDMIPILAKNKFSGALSLEVNLNLVIPQMKEAYVEFCSKAADEMLKLG